MGLIVHTRLRQQHTVAPFHLHSAQAPEQKPRGSSPAVDTEGYVGCLMSYGSKRCALLCFQEMETCPKFILTSQYCLLSGAELPATGSAPHSLAPSQSGIRCTLGLCASPDHIRAEPSPAALASGVMYLHVTIALGVQGQGPHPTAPTDPSSSRCPTPPSRLHRHCRAMTSDLHCF